MNIFKILGQVALDFIRLIYPRLCATCHQNLIRQEHILCTKCLYDLPRTGFHKIPGNAVEQTFWGRVPIERATSFFFFQKGSKYQHLLHLLKYQRRKDIGLELGRLFASELIQEPHFATIDYIVPVPLHYKKQQKRGFNQSEIIALGMQDFLTARVNTNLLYRKVYTETQTRKSRYERWENVEDVFGVKNPELIEGKHILLVDDVLTTGATLEGCAQVLKSAASVKISIATIGYASLQ